MPDTLSKADRARTMAAVKGRNTRPELEIRAALRAAGATGYRLHRRDLPGCPDLAFGRWRVAVFVDGGFWHGHPDRWHPDRMSSYWQLKITRNMERDRASDAALISSGWAVGRIWDHDLRRDKARCVERVVRALVDAGWPAPIR